MIIKYKKLPIIAVPIGMLDELMDKFKVSKRTCQYALDYTSNSEVAEQIRAYALALGGVKHSKIYFYEETITKYRPHHFKR